MRSAGILAAMSRAVRAVRSRPATAAVLASTALILASPASAQFPVCAGPAPGEVFVTSCRTWEPDKIVQLLDEFTVDHLLKPELPAFERTWMQLSTAFASTTLIESAEYRSLAKSLEPLRLTQLDRTTGTIAADLASAPRETSVKSTGFGEIVQLKLRFPETLAGGYWRGPDMLQIAFWEKSRLGITVSRGDAEIVSGDVACLALSSDGLMVRFADAGRAPFFLRIRDCEE